MYTPLVVFPDTTLRAEAVVSSALRPGGVLLLGPADVLRQAEEFELIGNDHAFAYRKLQAGALRRTAS